MPCALAVSPSAPALDSASDSARTVRFGRFGHSGPLSRKPRAAAVALLLVLTTFALSACGDKAADPQQAQGGPPKPPEVGVVTVQLRSVPLVADLPGRLEALRVAQVRARVAGIVQKRLFKEGSWVQAGQPLFQIDNTTYRANVQSAQANLALAEAQLAQTSATLRRYKPLVEANAISKQEYDAAVAAEKASRAQVAAGKAALSNAQVSLGYAHVQAPIAGRIGRALVTEGALVGQGEVTPLAVIQQTNPMYVNITQSSNDILRMREALSQGKLAKDTNTGTRVTVFTDDGNKIPQEGRLLFTDLTVDENTGQVLLRAEIPNPNGLLLPGMYVRVQLAQAQVDNATLIPQQAVTRNDKGDAVMVVASDGSVAPRPVHIRQSQGANWIITSGLHNGDKVMVDDMAKLAMGAKKVSPVPWVDPASVAASAPSASSTPANSPARP